SHPARGGESCATRRKCSPSSLTSTTSRFPWMLNVPTWILMLLHVNGLSNAYCIHIGSLLPKFSVLPRTLSIRASAPVLVVTVTSASNELTPYAASTGNAYVRRSR